MEGLGASALLCIIRAVGKAAAARAGHPLFPRAFSAPARPALPKGGGRGRSASSQLERACGARILLG
eukprot:2525918-Lingulodinium_polyedra.AAC.1